MQVRRALKLGLLKLFRRWGQVVGRGRPAGDWPAEYDRSVFLTSSFFLLHSLDSGRMDAEGIKPQILPPSFIGLLLFLPCGIA